jgi:hypothetical protein
LAWQQRKAASFMMTPLFCGYDLPEFRNDPTVKPFQPTSNREIYLGLAMATSGAAASPNMGYHSSPPLAFLMTMFNVRLGWWLGNTRNAKDWERGGPRIGLACLLSELLGRTHNKQRNIYLSDGGHFENLGIYELVRRRCRFIIACDAGQDPEMKFGDLGNAIEKCRTDFGVDIEIDIEPIRHDGEGGRSRWHCAVGTIHYDRLDSTLPEGTILYLKSSLTGDEPTDVQRYAAEQPLFPHQSTADQWFTESQFESYRMLGQHIAERVIEAATDGEEVRRKSAGETFAALRQHWYPPARAAEGSFTKHTETYARLLETMRATPSLAFLDRQVYPEWEALVKGASAMRSDSAQTTLWLPATEEERRAGFYFCGQVIQLMEDAYIDLDLEAEFDHPDNRGWKNLFRHWSWSGMFCATWAVSAGIYGARFQRFCERQLDLHVGNEIEFVGPFPAEDESLAQAHENDFLNFWEVALIKEFRTQCQAQQEGASGLSVIPLRIVVKTIGQPDSKSVSKDMKFTFGFVLGRVSGADSAKKLEIVYMRVQNHLRTMGFAKRGLHKLMSSYGVRNVLNNVTPCGSDARRKELLDAEQLSLLEALPSQKDCAAFTLLFEEVEKEEQFLADREAALRKRKPK